MRMISATVYGATAVAILWGTAACDVGANAPASGFDGAVVWLDAGDASTPEPPVYEREPTPCLDTLQADRFPIRKLDATEVQDAEEPSAGIVIFDRSGSMDGHWGVVEGSDPPEYMSKWDAAGEALLGAVGPVQERVTLGAIFFPQPDECTVAPISDPQQVDFCPGEDFITTWQSVAPLNPPHGGTPLDQAFNQAEIALEEACVAGLLDQRFFVMLLTDGMPTCDTDMVQVEDMARHWLDHGVPTYVFGLPGSEDASEVLNQISTAGGTETLIVPGDATDLEEGISVVM